MRRSQRSAVVGLEGRHVTVALQGGRRIDDCLLVSAGRGDVPHIWLFTNGEDRFVALAEVIDVVEVVGPRAA